MAAPDFKRPLYNRFRNANSVNVTHTHFPSVFVDPNEGV